MKSKSGIFLLALCFTALNLRPGITSVSPILNHLSHVLGMSGLVASLLTSVPVFCMGMFSPAAAKLGSRLGTERVLTGAVVLIGGATILRLWTHSALFLVATAFLIGVGIATASPLLAGFIRHHFPGRAGLMIGVYSASMVTGAAAGAGLTVPLMGWFGGSWRMALAIWGVLGIIAIPVWLVALRHPNSSHRATGSNEHAPLPWGNGRAWLFTVFFGLMAFLFYSFTAWIPPIVQSLGHSAAFAGAVATVFTIVQVPVGITLSTLTGKYPNRRPWLMLGSLFELVGLALLALTPVNPMVSAVIIGIGAGGLFPLALLLPIDATNTPAQASSWSAMEQSVGYVIGASGATIIGALRDATSSFTSSFGLLFVIILAMFAMEWFLTARAPA